MGDVFFVNGEGDTDSSRRQEAERLALWRRQAKGLNRLVLNPSGWWLSLWNTINRIAGVYVFLDVTFRIAFHPFGSFGFW